MNGIPSFFKNLLFVSSVIIFFTAICFAQNKVDLEVRAQAASETARGGETFSYTVTVKNIGSAKATNVFLIQDGNFGETSASSSAGTCDLFKESRQLPPPFRCMLGDIEQGESIIINFSIKLRDFGGEEQDNFSRSPTLPDYDQSEEAKAYRSKTTVADINVDSAEIEDHRENNRIEIRAEMLPSKNKPPRVRLISPKTETVIRKPLNKILEVPLVINASDPDGKITKVRVGEQNFQIIVEDNQYKFVFGGKKYTAQEAEDAREELAPYYGGDAVETGNGTYSYLWKSLRYGRNRVFIEAIDDGGRSGSTQLEIEVKSDSTIEITSPKNERIVMPGSTMIIETISKIGNGITPQLKIIGTEQTFPPTFDQLPSMRQISKIGNTYKHQFVWKVPKEEDFDFTIIVLENGEIPTL